LSEGTTGTASVQIIPFCMLLLLCQSYQYWNTQEQNENTGTTANFPTANSNNKKVSDLKPQQKYCCDQISQAIPSALPWHRWNLRSKLKASWQRLHGV